MAITVEQIETIAAKLRALPPIENKKRFVSKQESIKMLASEIDALRERGYTLEQVAELLTADHLEIGTSTLKSYLQRSQSSSKKAKIKGKAISVGPLPSSSARQSTGAGAGTCEDRAGPAGLVSTMSA
jgi:predicted DNA-binding protein (UPF0251 family)